MAMKIRNSKICFGTEALGGTDWGDFSLKDVEDSITTSFDLGLRSFDTAAIYGLATCETRLGEILGLGFMMSRLPLRGGYLGQITG